MAAFPLHPLVMTGDMVWLEASAVYSGTSAYRLRMGTVLELCVEEGIPEIKETIETNRKKGTGAVIETTEAQEMCIRDSSGSLCGTGRKIDAGGGETGRRRTSGEQ